MVTTTNIDELGSGNHIKHMVYLVWEDLSVLVSRSTSNSSQNKKKKLLSGLNGYAEAGRILAIMGPSGSGKSTLLDALAGRLSQDVEMGGDVLINGKRINTLMNQVSYVTQEDIFLQSFTVRETLTYSAHLRLPTHKMTKEAITMIVDDTISEMGLQDCADNKVESSWPAQSRGLSSGEKKRLSIAIEILTNPNVLLLDEPTTGLDSASSFFVIRALKTIAMDGKIVIFSIHQPSSDTFDLFDDLLLISNGETVYFGESKMAIKFFGDAGFLCPARRSPSDHFLRCISLDFDIVNAALMRRNINPDEEPRKPSDCVVNIEVAEIRDTLVENYKNSKYLINIRKKMKEIELVKELEVVEELNKESEARWLKQLITLTERSFLTMFRDIGYYWLRVICYAFVSIGIGSLYFNMGTDNEGIMARAKCVPFIFGFMVCLSCGGLPFFFQELKVFHRERRNRHYEVSAFVVSNFLSTFPFLVSTAMMSGTIIFFMVLFTPKFSHYCFFCINLFCCFALGEVYMIIVASLVPNVMMGIGLGVGTIVLFMMASPMSRPLQDLPKIFWRYPMSYLSCARWAIQGQYKNEMIGLEFDPPIAGAPKLKGEEIMLKASSFHCTQVQAQRFHAIAQDFQRDNSPQR
ncbi:hypothetical protein ACFE04_001696 [Oxalis oulophora]